MLAIERDRIMRDEAKRTADKYIGRCGEVVGVWRKSKMLAQDVARIADQYAPRRRNKVRRMATKAMTLDDDIPF